MSAPAVVITLSLEAAPRVTADCLSENEEKRLFDWLGAHPELLDLIALAYELRDGARIA